MFVAGKKTDSPQLTTVVGCSPRGVQEMSLGQCLDDYVNGNCTVNRGNPCYKCSTGHSRRARFAEDPVSLEEEVESPEDVVEEQEKSPVEGTMSQPSPKSLVEAVCEYFQLRRQEMTAPSHLGTNQAFYPRNLLLYLLVEVVGLPSREIGKLIDYQGVTRHFYGCYAMSRIRRWAENHSRDVDEDLAAVVALAESLSSKEKNNADPRL